ncbi:DUF397 domain-containing protein [Micromonospora sp. NPDC049559]|uniref:DUF397 domain-containing protein n=1 Tax=Micromonospora sp. NPDC049559 TaxID=3155923 RepID=UPI003428E1CB
MAERPDSWRRSSRCESHNCVEVAFVPGSGVRVRNSSGTGEPSIEFGAAAWRAFCAGLKAGHLAG